MWVNEKLVNIFFYGGFALLMVTFFTGAIIEQKKKDNSK